MSDEKLGRLMARARQERPPRTDVARAVIATVRAHEREQPVTLAPLAWVALAAAALAVPAGLAALGAWELISDPLLGLAGGLVWWAL